MEDSSLLETDCKMTCKKDAANGRLETVLWDLLVKSSVYLLDGQCGFATPSFATTASR